MKIEHKGKSQVVLEGKGGSLVIDRDDEVAWKLAMLMEGECSDRARKEVVEDYDYSTQRYYQLRKSYEKEGTDGLKNKKRGPKTNYRRGGEATRQIIRYRYLDPDVSSEVIGQRLRQKGFNVSDRSVYRVFEDYGLQKKGSISAIHKRILNRLK